MKLTARGSQQQRLSPGQSRWLAPQRRAAAPRCPSTHPQQGGPADGDLQVGDAEPPRPRLLVTHPESTVKLMQERPISRRRQSPWPVHVVRGVAVEETWIVIDSHSVVHCAPELGSWMSPAQRAAEVKTCVLSRRPAGLWARSGHDSAAPADTVAANLSHVQTEQETRIVCDHARVKRRLLLLLSILIHNHDHECLEQEQDDGLPTRAARIPAPPAAKQERAPRQQQLLQDAKGRVLSWHSRGAP